MINIIREMEFYCPMNEGHNITDPDKSSKNWKVYRSKCPVCGSVPKWRWISRPKKGDK